MKIAFIFILYNTPQEEVTRLSKEVASLKIKNFSLHFIDNTRKNKGYAQGVNEGLTEALHADADIFVVANPDISIRNLKFPSTIPFDIFSFGMKQEDKIYYCGEVDKLRLSSHLSLNKPKTKYASCQYVTGSLLVIKKKVIESVGLFDENYFMYYEDLDYCTRARNSGFTVGIDTTQHYLHYEVSKKNPEKNYLLAKSRLRYFFKYSNWKQKIYETIRIPKSLIEERTLLINQIIRRKFLFNFLIFNSSSVVNRFLNFVLFIFLARLLTVEDYGIYALVWAHVSIISPLVDLGTTTYGLVNLPNESEKRYSSLFSFRFYLSVIALLVTVGLAYIFNYDNYVILFILLTSFTLIANSWSGSYLVLTSIKEKLHKSSIASVIFNLVLILSTVVSLIFFRSLFVVFLIIFISYNLYSIVNIALIRNEISNFKLRFEVKQWADIFKKSYVYVLIALLAGIYFKVDVLLLQSMQSTSAVGIYSAGFKFFEALIFVAIGYNTVAVPRLSRIYSQSKQLFFTKVHQDAFFMGVTGLLLSVAVYYTSPFILGYLLGDNFAGSLQVLRIVIFSLPFLLISTVFLSSLYILKKAYLVVILFAVQSLLSISLNFFLIPQFSYIASSYITILNEVVNVVATLGIFLYYKSKLQ